MMAGICIVSLVLEVFLFNVTQLICVAYAQLEAFITGL